LAPPNCGDILADFLPKWPERKTAKIYSSSYKAIGKAPCPKKRRNLFNLPGNYFIENGGILI
jgi:hypothetical protein